MNVGKLIQELQKYDPVLPAMVNGYEGGISEEQLKVKLVSVNRNENEGLTSGLFGEHGEDYWTKVPHDLAVLISRDAEEEEIIV